MSVDLGALNTYLADKTYMAGYAPSSEDLAAFNAIPASAVAGAGPHVQRFYKLVDSWSFVQKSRCGHKLLNMLVHVRLYCVCVYVRALCGLAGP